MIRKRQGSNDLSLSHLCRFIENQADRKFRRGASKQKNIIFIYYALQLNLINSKLLSND